MARTKERETAALSSNEICNAGDTSVFLTATYVRISSEDERKIESKSVENQTAMLKDFVDGQEDMKLYKCYCDRDISGTTFDRPEFQRMMEDMKKGKFQCIVVKDLSRLGRNFIETCEYIETIFPLFGIRFVSVTDRFDTLHPKLTEDGLVVPLKNLFNEAYAKDISKKIGASKEKMQRSGIFVGKAAPYGYKKSEEQKGVLIPDENTKHIIQRIFQLRADGVSVSQITRILNDEKIDSPMQYRYKMGIDKTDKYADVSWKRKLVTSILRNVAYIGDMEQGYQKQSLYRGISVHKQKKSERIYVKQVHEPIVDADVFMKVQELLDEEERKYKENHQKYKDLKRREDIFRGILYCADCDVKLTLYRRTVRLDSGLRHYYTYLCRETSSYGDGRCVAKNFKMEKMEEIVIDLIKAHIRLYEEKETMIRKLNSSLRAVDMRTMYLEEKTKLISALELNQNRNANIYDDFADGLLEKTEYLLLKEEYKKEREKITDDLALLNEKIDFLSPEYCADVEMKQTISEYEGFNELTSEIIKAFIKKIIVYDKVRIEVFYVFADVFAKMDTVIEDRRRLLDGID